MRLAGRHEPTGPPGLGRARARMPRRRRRRASSSRAAAAAEATAESAALHAPAGAASDRGHGRRRQAPRRRVRALRSSARQHGEAVSALRGKYECGEVQYSVADAFLYAMNCHCSACRAATGSAFKPFAGIEREKLELHAGPDTLLVVGDDDLNDTRCASCGSLLFSVVRDGAYVHVALGSLADAPSIRPQE